jgi:hypothetical protein
VRRLAFFSVAGELAGPALENFHQFKIGYLGPLPTNK